MSKPTGIFFQSPVHDASLHDLHGTASNYRTCLVSRVNGGAHPTTVSERLGHASIGITFDTYSRAMSGMQEEAAEKVETGLRVASAGL